MLRDWIDPKLGLVLEGEKLVEIDSSNYLGSCISPGDRKSAYTKCSIGTYQFTKHLWRPFTKQSKHNASGGLTTTQLFNMQWKLTFKSVLTNPRPLGGRTVS